MQPVILAIESSCDETSAAVIRNGKVLNNVVASQNVHQNYGGVVPELASRAHQSKIQHVVNEAILTSGVSKHDLSAVAFTAGPGLMGSLLVGSSFAKGLALALGIPLIEVNHMEAHVLAHFIPRKNLQGDEAVPSFPFLCLTVSGGHTQILLVRDFLSMEVIGETRDDAVGEAFDKAAKILGLPYPGGPLIDRYAQSGNPLKYTFPGSSMPDLDFSFSGIKTAFLYFIRDGKEKDPDFVSKELSHICASVQFQLVKMLLQKLELATIRTGIKEVAIAGGVSANSSLRSSLERKAKELNWTIHIPPFEYCTDNAAMVAMAAHYKFLSGRFADLSASPVPSLEINSHP